MVYATLKGFRPLTLDLYLPQAKSFPRPALVFVHGGAWNSGDARHNGGFSDFPALLNALAARGYVVASVNYRLSGEAPFPAALQDVKSTIRWLRSHKTDFNLEDTRIAVWGAGAGGQLAALAGVSCGVAILEPKGEAGAPSDCVQGVIDWYGVSDFESMAADLGKPAPDKSDAGDFLGCEPSLCAIGVARNASPLAYIQPMSPPFLIQHGAQDMSVSPRQSQKLYDALRARNVPAQLAIYPGVGRDFARDGAAPNPATSQAALEKLAGFLEGLFPKKPPAGTPVKPNALPY